MNNLPKQPHKGLEPYQEQDKDNFFGREVDKWILVVAVIGQRRNPETGGGNRLGVGENGPLVIKRFGNYF